MTTQSDESSESLALYTLVQLRYHVTGNKKGIGGYAPIYNRTAKTGPQFGQEYITRAIQRSRHSVFSTRLSAFVKIEKRVERKERRQKMDTPSNLDEQVST